MSELTDDRPLPCPFCGHEAVHQNHSARPGEYWYANSFIRCPNCKASGPIGSQDEAVTAWNRRAAASTSTEGAGVKAAADQLLAALQRYGFPVSDAAVRPLMDGGSLEAQAVHVAAMQLRAKLNPPASKVTTDEAGERG